MMILHRLRIVQQLFLGAVHNKHGLIAQKKKAGERINSVTATFRCFPIDTAFGHMNNSAIITVAELKRWRMFTELDILPILLKKKALLMIAEQTAIYHKPILPMREYIVISTLKITGDKWLHYVHSFEQHPDDVPDGVEAVKFATVNVKGVMKPLLAKQSDPLS